MVHGQDIVQRDRKEKRFQFMKSVLPLPEKIQDQVDLARRIPADGHE
jgi:hypothetical protein